MNLEKPQEKNITSFNLEETEKGLREKFAYTNFSQTQWENSPSDEDFMGILDMELEVYDKSDYALSRGELLSKSGFETDLEKLELLKEGLQNFPALLDRIGDEEVLNLLIGLDEIDQKLKVRENYITEKARGLGFVHAMSREAIKRFKNIVDENS